MNIAARFSQISEIDNNLNHGRARIKFVWEAFNVVGDVGEGKNNGGA